MTSQQYGTAEYRAYRQANRYGLTVKELHRKLEDQNNRCKICCANIDITNLSIDHDQNCCEPSSKKNTCGKCTRGLLCYRCNIFIGYLESANEDAILDEALKYLGYYQPGMLKAD